MSLVTPTLETARLILCPLQISDADQVQVLFPHWEIVRYLNSRVPWPYPSDGVYTFYRDVALPAVENGTAWEWTLRFRSEPERVIGAISLRKSETDNRGFWLGLAWQRKGLMTEACDAVTSFGSRHWDLIYCVSQKPSLISLPEKSLLSKGCESFWLRSATMYVADCPPRFGRLLLRNGDFGEPKHRDAPHSSTSKVPVDIATAN
jgi:RimJ/RimL family protein N-acetyltransferase